MSQANSTPAATKPRRAGCRIETVRVGERRRGRFRRKLAELRRETLLRNVDLLLDQADRAKARGDCWLAAWAMARWNACWDELDRRDGVSGSGSAA